jgi:2'-5' RNA ligase
MGLFADIDPVREMAEYYLALVPSDPLRTEIRDIQNSIHAQYGVKGALFSPPHLTLAENFFNEPEREDALVDHLKNEAGKHDPFILELSGFKNFGSRTIYIDVVETEAFQKFRRAQFEALYSFFRQRGIKKKLKECTTPHLTIAAHDLGTNFKPIWSEFENRQYGASLEVNNICLLRKRADRTWEDAHYLPLR